MTMDGGGRGSAVDGFSPHAAAARAEELQALLESKDPARFVNEALADLEGIEDSGKYVTPAYRFALEKLKVNLGMLNPYRDAVQTAIQVVLERETEELERQQQRQIQVMEAEEAEIHLHMLNKQKAMEAKKEDEERRAKEVRRIENVFAGEMTKLKQEAKAYQTEVNYDIEENNIKMDGEREKLRREINAEVDDLISDFEAWKTEQLLKLQSQQAEILESSAAAKEELAADLDKLHEKINHYEAEVARLTEGLGAAEREVHLAQMELENARAAAEESLRLADLASTAFQPQAERLREVQEQKAQESSKKESTWRAKEGVIQEEEKRRSEEAAVKLEEMTQGHKELIMHQMEEMAALEQRATKELELRDRDISASQARVEEARGAAIAAREALAEKRHALKAEQEAALLEKRALDEQLVADGSLSKDTFAGRRTEVEAQYVLASEAVKVEEVEVRRTCGSMRATQMSAAKEEAERGRNGLDREQRALLSKMKDIYEEIGYARAEISDQQDFLNESAGRHRADMEAAAGKVDAADSAARERVGALQREHALMADAADKEADLVKDGTRAAERAATVASEDAAIREEDAATVAHCAGRGAELLALFETQVGDEAAAAGRTVEAATNSVAAAEGELAELAGRMGPRGQLLQGGVGMADVYSAMLQRVETRLKTDRQVVGSTVEAEEAEAAKFEDDTRRALVAQAAAFERSIANSRAELAAEEAAAEALQDSLVAYHAVQRSVAEGKLSAWRAQLSAVRERAAAEADKLKAAEAEGTAVQEEVAKELAEIEREEASGKVVEHVPGVVLSLPMRREAAELRGNQAALRLALLRSSCSAEGALHHEEADLQGRIAELEGDAERHAARLEGQRRRALQVLEAKRAAHTALETMLNEQLGDERAASESAITQRRKRVAGMKERLEGGWNDAQEVLSEIIAAGKPLVTSLQEAGKLYTEDDDKKLRDLLRRLTSAKMSLDLVGLEHVERDHRCLSKQRASWAELEHEVLRMQGKTRARADEVDLLRRTDVAAALNKQRVRDLYSAAARKAEDLQREEGRRKTAAADAAATAEAAEAEAVKRAEAGQQAIATARARLESALGAAAAHEAEVDGVMERYAGVVARLDEQLRAAETLGADELDRVAAKAAEAAEERAAGLAAVDEEEAAWAERTDGSGAYKQRRLEEISAPMNALKAQVEEMERVVASADEATAALELTEAETVRKRGADSDEAQSHYQARIAELQAEVNGLMGKPKDDFDLAVATMEAELARRREAIQQEREEFAEICKLYEDEEASLQAEIDLLSAEAAGVLDRADMHKQNLARVEERMAAAEAELEAQNRLVQKSLMENKRTLNVYERDAMRASEEIEAIDVDVKDEIELLQSTTHERIAERETRAVALRADKMAQLEEKLAKIDQRVAEFESSKQTFLEAELERIRDGELLAEESMTEALQKVSILAQEREEARQEALARDDAGRTALREKEVEKEQEAALRYEAEMQMLADDLETLYGGLQKAERMHKAALEEEQIRERERVEQATISELDVELRKKQEEARLLFEKEKMRMRSETDLLASAAEEELRLEEEKAIAALRERRKERLKAVEAKRQEIRSQLEQTWIESQVKIREEHIEQQHVKLSLVSKAFGFFGKKRPSSAQRLRDAVQGSAPREDEDEEAAAWEERKKMERELAKLEAEMSALEAVKDI